jgi:hypothetical protein
VAAGDLTDHAWALVEEVLVGARGSPGRPNSAARRALNGILPDARATAGDVGVEPGREGKIAHRHPGSGSAGGMNAPLRPSPMRAGRRSSPPSAGGLPA